MSITSTTEPICLRADSALKGHVMLFGAVAAITRCSVYFTADVPHHGLINPAAG